jgi:hypothetical protein
MGFINFRGYGDAADAQAMVCVFSSRPSHISIDYILNAFLWFLQKPTPAPAPRSFCTFSIYRMNNAIVGSLEVSR